MRCGHRAYALKRSLLTHSGHRGGCQFVLQHTWGRLLDDLIGGHKQALWHFEAERLCSLEVDDKLELGRLHDREVDGPQRREIKRRVARAER
jgi:hypothetical protein